MKNRTSLASFTMLSFVLICAAWATLTISCAAKPKIKPETGASTASLTASEARELAREAWLFGRPLVMFEKQFDYGSYATKPTETRAPVNQFVHYRKFVDASNRTVVGFNVDNLYSFASLDLAAEPIVLSIPEMGARFWLMQIIDAWNGVPAAPGSRTHGGTNAHDFLIAGPDWTGVAPDGMELLRSPTNLVLIGGRTYCAGEDDYAAVNELQDQYKLTPLSAWAEPYTPPANVPLKEGVDGETLVNEQVMALDAEEFFSNLNRLMATNPPYAADAPMLRKLLPLGIAPGAPFSTAALSVDVNAAIAEGVVEGKAALAAEMKSLGKIVNNWTLTYDMGRYGTKYTYRAAWTFVSDIAPGPDGSLTIYIQSESPGKDKEANWLPAPKTAPFKMALRLYAPRESVRDGSWVPQRSCAWIEHRGPSLGETREESQ